jgi:tRNA(Ile)-lysidine synthase TilS/MesJ
MLSAGGNLLERFHNKYLQKLTRFAWFSPRKTMCIAFSGAHLL